MIKWLRKILHLLVGSPQNSITCRWRNWDECDLCGKLSPGGWDVEVAYPDMNFHWCEECSKNTKKCDEKINQAIKEYYQKKIGRIEE